MSKRTWTNQAVDKEGNLVRFEELVVQHDVRRSGDVFYWRGAAITPRFSQ